MPAHDVFPPRDHHAVVVVQMETAEEIDQRRIGFGDGSPRLGASANLGIVGNEHLRRTKFLEDGDERFFGLDVVPADQPIPFRAQQKSRLRVVVGQSLVA